MRSSGRRPSEAGGRSFKDPEFSRRNPGGIFLKGVGYLGTWVSRYPKRLIVVGIWFYFWTVFCPGSQPLRPILDWSVFSFVDPCGCLLVWPFYHRGRLGCPLTLRGVSVVGRS